MRSNQGAGPSAGSQIDTCPRDSSIKLGAS